MADFDKALLYCLQNEGGFADKADDKGGPTNKGITKAILTRYRGKEATTDDVKTLGDNEIAAIYRAFFWGPLNISSLSQPIATAIFDTAVNQGQSAAIKLAQEALGIRADGIMGGNTVSALAYAEPKEFIFDYIGRIQDKYVKICMYAANQMVFLEGWLKRSRRLFLLIFPQ